MEIGENDWLISNRTCCFPPALAGKGTDKQRSEVHEETGLEIKNIRYFGSQPWPYPMGLMIGFHADYAGGDIALVDGELSDAAFFKRDNLPPIPEKLSMARMLIDNWLSNDNI